MSDDRTLLLGCGILKKEVQWLVEKNHWPLDTSFLSSSLHMDLDGLAHRLTAGLAANATRRVLVLYGTCHPRMDVMLAEHESLRASRGDGAGPIAARIAVVGPGDSPPWCSAGTRICRTPVQNCVELLLGSRQFTEELAAGAYFLFEEWARNWRPMLTKAFGENLGIARQIFQGDRKYFLALHTPCAADFSAEAEAVSRLMGLPWRRMEVSLEHLESVLETSLAQLAGEVPCRS